MEVLKTYTKGYGANVTHTQDWTGLPKVVAVVAPNGTGKSVFITSGFRAYYGEAPGYEGDIYDAASQSGDGNAEDWEEFKYDGHTYKVRRVIRVTENSRTQKVYVYKDGKKKPIAGPKKTDVDRFILNLLGPARVAASSWFCAQRAAEDLTEIPRSERRKVIADALGHKPINSWSKKANAKALHHEREAKSFQVALDSLEFDFEAYKALLNQKQELEAQASGLDQKLIKIQTEIDSAIVHENSCEAKWAALSDLAEAHDEAKDLQERITQTKQAIEDNKRTLLQIAEAEELIKGKESLLTQSQLHKEWHAWDNKKVDLWNRMCEVEEEYQAYLKVIQTTEAGVLDIVYYTDYEAELEKATKALESTKVQIQQFKTHKEVVLTRLELLPKPVETPADKEVCFTCPLYQKVSDAGPERERLLSELRRLDQSLAFYTSRLEYTQEAFDKLKEQAVQSQIAKRLLDSLPYQKQQETWEESLKLRAELAEHFKNEPEKPEVSDLDLKQLNDIDNAELKLSILREVAQPAHRLQERLDRLNDAYSKVDLTDLLLACPTDKQIQKAKQKWSEAHTQLKELRNQHLETQRDFADVNSSLSRILGNLEVNTSKYNKAVNLKRQIKFHSGHAEEWRTIEKAFAPTGVQALLVDQALAGIQAEANQILATLTDDAFTVELVTQTETKKGTLKEDLEILVTDQHGTRKVGQYSGAQRKLVQISLRLGLTLWSAKNSGYAVGSLYIDEIFDGLDDANVLKVIELLEDLGEHFTRIVVVTHSPRLSSLIPGRINL